MAKRRLSLCVRIPPYRTPRIAWRRDLHAVITRRQCESKVRYSAEDRLEVHVRLYFDKSAVRWHDVDNRLKDILDALQGRCGGPKNKHPFAAVIPNDRQVYRVIVEKGVAPGQSHGLGHLVVRKFQGRARTERSGC